MTKQLSLIKTPRKETKKWWIVERSVYGGSMNYRKLPRPFDSKKLSHVVLKANLGPALWFTHRQHSIRKLLTSVAARYGVKIKSVAINTDHIHLLLYTKHKENQIRFLRLLTAEMGRNYRRIKQSYGINKLGSLWLSRPFTRLVSWGKKSIESVCRYIQKNHDEAMGFIDYQPRKHRLNIFLALWREQVIDSG